MEWIHVCDNVKALHKVSIFLYEVTMECVSYRHLGTRSVNSWNANSQLVVEYGQFTNPKNAVKHRIAYGNARLVCISGLFNILLTSKRFQIRCECAASQEPECKNLYKW